MYWNGNSTLNWDLLISYILLTLNDTENAHDSPSLNVFSIEEIKNETKTISNALV